MFKKSLLLTICGLELLACSYSTEFINQPSNIDFSIYNAKAWVRAYHDSGAYLADVSRIAREAQTYLDQRLVEGVYKPAIVFDVDDTLLSNYAYFDKEVDFAYLKKLNTLNENLRNDLPPLEPVVALCRYALSRNVATFIITGRFERRKHATEANLKKIGCEGYRDIYFRDSVEETWPAATYKTAERQMISREGYTILVNIGDQESDLRGGYAERTFKLPNYFYLIP
jgi:predicted secreted acid phosphatase